MRQAYLSGTFIFLFAAVIVLQIFSDHEKAKATYIEPSVLKPDMIRVIDLGLHNAAADLLWLASIQYFGGNESKKYEKLADYINTSIELDPLFSYPYAFGELILPGMGKLDNAIALGVKGSGLKLKDWRIPYYLAATYHINKDDRINAAKYFDVAANTEGAPENVKKIAARYGSGIDNRSQTKQIWIGIYETSNDEVVKERAKKYIIHFELLEILDQASAIYKEKFQKYPSSVEELVNARILKQAPVDPFGFSYTFNTDGKAELK